MEPLGPFLPLFFLLFLSAGATAAEGEEPKPSRGGNIRAEDQGLVSEYFSQASQPLIPYSWYGNAKLFSFRVPEDALLLRWLLQASRGKGRSCHDVEISVHVRFGAPPVINPLSTQFPANVSVRLAHRLSLSLSAARQNSTFLNLTSPAAGYWFLVAHLPKADGKIQVQGVSSPCSYVFQPDLFVLRMVDMPILQPNIPLRRTIWTNRPLHAKVFVPSYSAMLHLELGACTVNVSSTPCAVRVMLGLVTLSESFSRKEFNCTGPCNLFLASPPWEKWLRITVDSLSGPGAGVSFTVTASFTACWPGGPSSFLSFFQSLNRSQEVSQPGGRPSNATLPANTEVADPPGSCLRDHAVIREDLDIVWVRFRILGDTNIPVQAQLPSLLLLNLDSIADSGGTLVVNLLLNKTSPGIGNATVRACLSAASPVLSLNATEDCETGEHVSGRSVLSAQGPMWLDCPSGVEGGGGEAHGPPSLSLSSLTSFTAFFQGYGLNVSTSSPEASLVVPYPESDNWFLSLQLVCPEPSAECLQAKAQLVVLAYLSPCVDDCGMYGQCSLMRRHGYLYAGCNCKAAIVVALHRYHLVEAAVYTFTMFFSAFYHACDQPGVVVFCIMDYDTLQYCDFLGSVVSLWVTILCMARIKTMLKYVLCVLGTLFIAMSLSLDRRGVWNMLGPSLVALTIMTSAWVFRCVNRRHCYPPSWRRWAFFLLPGVGLALVAGSVYALTETSENYYYTHSLWHMLVATSLVFLLPPGEKQQESWSWSWSRKLFCRYEICQNDRDEMYTAT
ncbi:post-GPI attachment to proteins factor 6 isoform X2 [Anolis carolinensis]|uniref:post-GPI attachment to proteins factor 6 isoform X2 n=1 Tax=Anolis carolinensis TaxID=28377 RepID=UPI002F2B4623